MTKSNKELKLMLVRKNRRIRIGKIKDQDQFLIEFKRLVEDEEDLKPSAICEIKGGKIKITKLLLSIDGLAELHILLGETIKRVSQK